MLNARDSKRVKAVLPLKIWGTTPEGDPFTDLAHTLDIGRNGARVGSVRRVLRVGDIINIGYKHRRAKFRIVWMRRPAEEAIQLHLGLECTNPDDSFWGVSFVNGEIAAPPIATRTLVKSPALTRDWLTPNGSNTQL